MKKPVETSYESFAETYLEGSEGKAYISYYERPFMTSQLTELKGTTVLDLGCASGYYSKYCLDRGAEVISVDASPRMVEHCLEICGRRNTAYVHDIGTAFHFIAAAEIDTIICSLVLHYIAEWPPVLQEFRRILKPGGRCIISTHHPVNDYIYFNKENYFSKKLIEDEWQGFSPPLHVKYWVRPLQEYIQPLLESGLSLLTLAEPGPSDELKEKDEQRYERLMTQPAFLFFVLQKRE